MEFTYFEFMRERESGGGEELLSELTIWKEMFSSLIDLFCQLSEVIEPFGTIHCQSTIAAPINLPRR